MHDVELLDVAEPLQEIVDETEHVAQGKRGLR